MKQVKKVHIPIALFITLYSMVFSANTAFAFDINTATPNEMTPQQSRQIYEQRQIFKAVAIGVPVVIVVIIAIRKLNAKKARDSRKFKKPKK